MENEITIDYIIDLLREAGYFARFEEIKEYLKQLEKDSIKLSYLEAYGIDNTIAYEQAMEAYYNEMEK